MIVENIKKQPWFKVGIDIYETHEQNFLIIVDYYSKYPEVVSLHNNLTTVNVINKLKSVFSRHGIPQIVMSDNARQFNSNEYNQFGKECIVLLYYYVTN